MRTIEQLKPFSVIDLDIDTKQWLRENSPKMYKKLEKYCIRADVVSVLDDFLIHIEERLSEKTI